MTNYKQVLVKCSVSRFLAESLNKYVFYKDGKKLFLVGKVSNKIFITPKSTYEVQILYGFMNIELYL